MSIRSIRTLLFTAALTAFAVCLAQTASAQTYIPSSVKCLTGNIGDYSYEPQADAPANGVDVDLEADYDIGYEFPTAAQCTWTGFSTTITSTTTDMTLSLYEAANAGPASASCGLAVWHITALGTTLLHTGCKGTDGTLTFDVPVGTNLVTYTVMGSIILESSEPAGFDDADLYISYIKIQ